MTWIKAGGKIPPARFTPEVNRRLRQVNVRPGNLAFTAGTIRFGDPQVGS